MEPETQAMLTTDHWIWIQAQAHSLGFLECAVLPLQVDPRFKSYAEWIDQGHHEPLGYLGQNLDKREDPRKLGEHLRSAVVFLHPYPQDFSSRHIARYAWGGDYHHIIRDKLKSLSANFQTSFGKLAEEKPCVDTIPLLERSLAERSGLGWIGKNGCLISRRHGSFFLLAAWLISSEISPSTIPTPGSFHCGTCTRCMVACPTQAFIQPGMLEAKLCLSTQTIENRQAISPDFFKSIQKQAFGCDICQEVCPWNRKTTPTVQQEHLPPLLNLLTSPEPEFRAYFRNTALERPGWAGLRRNFLILAAHDCEISDALFTSHLNHSSEMIRQTARDILAWRNKKI
jgi:epoxyqueuosine reductase